MSGNNLPWDFEEARDALRKAAHAQELAEEGVRHAAQEAALADEHYRVALAKRTVELRAEGQPATLCDTLARGDERVAELRRKRGIADGVYEAMKQAAWRHNQNRKDAQRLADWSQRRELAEGGAQPEWSPRIVQGRN